MPRAASFLMADRRQPAPSGATQPAKRPWRRGLIFLAWLAAALLGFVVIRRLVDFPVYFQGGRSLLSGRDDLYAGDFAVSRVMDYRYPPFFLVALAPLWLLPYAAAAYLWYITSLAQIAAIATMLRRLIGRHKQSLKVAIVTVLAVAPYFVLVLHYGNAHLLVTFLLIASFYLFIREKQTAAALLMALGITIKLTPVLTLPYFFIRKQWRFLLLTATFTGLLNLLPAVWFGFSTNAALLRTWYGHVVADQEFHEINGPINLSLKGQLRRTFTEVDYTRRVDGDSRYPAVNVARFETAQTDFAWRAASALVFAAGLFLIWWGRWRRRTGEPATMLELGLMVCLSLFVGPMTSKIYFVALVWPVAALADFGFRAASPAARAARYIAIIVAITNFVLPLLPGSAIQRRLLVVGVDFYLNLLLMGGLAAVLLAFGREIPEPDGAPPSQGR